VSLRSLLRPGAGDWFQDQLNELLCYFNQARFVVSVALKRAFLNDLQHEWELVTPLRQTHVTQAFSLIRNANLTKEDHLTASIRGALEHVLQTMRLELKVPNVRYKSLFSQIEALLANQFLASLKSHYRRQLVPSLKTYLKNSFRAIGPLDVIEDPRALWPYIRANFHSHPAILNEYSAIEKSVKDLLKLDSLDIFAAAESNESTGDDKDDIDLCGSISVMFQIQQAAEQLQASSGRAMQYVCVIPENGLHQAPLLMDTCVIARLIQEHRAQLEGNVDDDDDEEEEEEEEEEKKKNKRYSFRYLCDPSHQAETWNYFFNVSAIQKLRRNAEFGWSMRTDHVSADVSFLTLREKREFKSAPNTANRPPLRSLPPGQYSESFLRQRYHGIDVTNSVFIGVDVGIRHPVSTWDLSADKASFEVSQAHYLRQSRRDGPQPLKRKMDQELREFTESMSKLPSAKVVDLTAMDSRLVKIGSHWLQVWATVGRRKYQSDRFEKYKSRQRFFSELTSQFLGKPVRPRKAKWRRRQKRRKRRKKRAAVPPASSLAPPPAPPPPAPPPPARPRIILWGAAGSGKGGFSKVRGGGKWPMKAFKRHLGRFLPVVTVSEWRTTCCCWICGRYLQYLKGTRNKDMVSVCTSGLHRRVLQSRDRDAARKISYRFALNMRGDGLGVWSTGFRAADVDSANCDVFRTAFPKDCERLVY
jgi:hypothetical protein